MRKGKRNVSSASVHPPAKLRVHMHAIQIPNGGVAVLNKSHIFYYSVTLVIFIVEARS